jgi:hypothetical protein
MFQVGDRVIILGGMNEHAGKCGVIIKTDNSDIANLIKLDNGELTQYGNSSLWKRSIDLILLERGNKSMSKYDELKARIDKVEGWTKEADDILQEIYKNSNDAYYALSIGVRDTENHRGTQEIRIQMGESAIEQVRFPFISQCSKNTAFKQALMWLLDNSSIKKDTLMGEYLR